MYEWNDYVGNEYFDLEDLARGEHGVRIDPYLIWAYTTKFKYVDVEILGRERLLPIIIELKKVYSAQNPEDQKILEDLLDGSVYIPFHRFLPTTKFLTAKIPERTFFKLLQSDDKANLIERFELGLTATSTLDVEKVKPESRVFSSAKDEATKTEPLSIGVGYTEREPIVGIIDDGIAFLNQRFQYANGGTRIHYLWNQNRTDNDDEAQRAEEDEKSNTDFGRLLTKPEMDDLILECYEGDVTYPTMEDRIYLREKMPGLARAVSHGTHLLDVAAGEDPQSVFSHKEIVAVQLPQPDRRFSDTSGNWLKVSAFQALQFLTLAANQVAVSKPKAPGGAADERDLVVNLSFGNFAGPHDGSSILEQGIDFLIESASELSHVKSLSVHIAAGNQRQSKCHANIGVNKNSPAVFHWQILPEDSTPSYMEVWFEDVAENDSLSIEIKPPVDTRLGTTEDLKFPVGAGVCRVLSDTGNALPVCTYVSLAKDRNATGDKTMALIAISPTSQGSYYSHAPAGVWEIKISNESSTSCEVSAWIQRDDSRGGNPIRARQSYFADPHYNSTDKMGYPSRPDQKQEGYVSQEDTVNGIATGKLVTTVGAYRYSGRGKVDYSGHKKELVEDVRLNRFVHAVAEDSLANPGVIASGSKSGSRVALNGTSVANAVVTRHRYEKLEFDKFVGEHKRLKSTWGVEKKKARIQNQKNGNLKIFT